MVFYLSNKIYIKYLLIFISITIFTTGVVSYYLIINYKSNRIYNPRKVPKEYRVDLIKDYISRVYEKNSILFIGDSQPNGHRYPTDKIFTTLLQDKINQNVLNLSFQDAQILDNIYIANYLKGKNMLFDAIIFNINQSHIKNSDFRRLDIENIQDYKIGILKEMKSFLKFSLEPNPINIPNEKIYLSKYENYFDMNASSINSYNDKLLNLITILKNISNNIIIYITPHPINAVLYNNKNDIKLLESFSKKIFKICNQVNIQCIEPYIKDDKYYIDIVHFNSLGHQEMSNILSQLLRTMK